MHPFLFNALGSEFFLPDSKIKAPACFVFTGLGYVYQFIFSLHDSFVLGVALIYNIKLGFSM